MQQLKISYIPITDLKQYEKNARRHSDEDIAAIVRSIEEFGFDDPIGVWGKENLIVEGHGRFLAAQQLGMEKVPVIRLDHLTEEQRKAYALAHNRTAELSGWDFAVLEEELKELEKDFEMSDFGFDSYAVDHDALDDLFSPAQNEQKEETEEPKKIQCPKCGEWFTP